ncbi:angiopoietin-related protein 1-like [Zeugodacus cucurbitae]|uniref:angiopoietin-related protein 1-like n=1 Tax=Zeugodacus cucurbitae TaxID=28588 RepID=UPI0023D92A41|nr:angiopoietin-related protein 1-like [Zeugodacus cucurbitae]XP_054083699.1 angiopoietin-related protein 1-like [Zeugodacus cucurbitae]
MSRFNFIAVLNYFLILQIRLSFSYDNDTCTVCKCDCNCTVKLAVEDEGMSEDQIVTTEANIEEQIIANRATNPSSCMEAAANSLNSGVYKIKLEKMNITGLEVFCEENVDSGGWLVIQRRQSNSVDFNRNWQDYKKGFGDLKGDYWFGLEQLHALTSSCEQELYIQLQIDSGETYFVKYSEFVIADESEDYALKNIGKYSGNAGNGLRTHLSMKFSTYDRDNDIYKDNCAMIFKGGWWFRSCYRSNLNGLYGDDKFGLKWVDIERRELIVFAQMMIRPTQNCWRQLMLSNLNR